MNATINSIGIYHPKEKVYNTYFEERLETSDKWIKERTGIESRFFASSDEYTSDMCVQAAMSLSDNYNKDKDKLYIPNTERSTLTYVAMQKHCDARGIKVYNATRGGKLEVFPRVDFDTLF